MKDGTIKIISSSYALARGSNDGSGGVMSPEGTLVPEPGALRGTGWYRYAPVPSKDLKTRSTNPGAWNNVSGSIE